MREGGVEGSIAGERHQQTLPVQHAGRLQVALSVPRGQQEAHHGPRLQLGLETGQQLELGREPKTRQQLGLVLELELGPEQELPC